MSQGSHSTSKREAGPDLLHSAGDPYNHRPSPILTDTERRRSLDDMRRLSEEIKMERARIGIRVPV
jgi:hypothetical protein